MYSKDDERGSCRFYTGFNYTLKEIIRQDSLILATKDFDFLRTFVKLNTFSLLFLHFLFQKKHYAGAFNNTKKKKLLYQHQLDSFL